MARAASEAKATANDTFDVEAVLSAEEETDAYERVLAVCENSIAEYTSFLEANEESDDEATNVAHVSAELECYNNWRWLFAKMSSAYYLGFNIYFDQICEDFVPDRTQRA